MIRENTVFILGAGASKPFDYPTGFELRKKICNENMNQIILQDQKIIQRHQIDDFKKTFSNSLNLSIDLFLSRNKKYESMGKYAIIQQILKAEHKSKEPSDIYDEQNWISYLYERLTKKFTDDSYNKIGDNKIDIITFNYDRLVENSLYKALKNSFVSRNEEESKAEMSRLGILHVYGKIAPLDWEQKEGIKYKIDLGSINISKYLDNIQVLYDQREIQNRALIDFTLEKAERIFFLGFGYADENLEVLDINNNLNKDQQIYGTALDSTRNEIDRIKSKFLVYGKIKPRNLIIEDCDCLTLLRDHLK